MKSQLVQFTVVGLAALGFASISTSATAAETESATLTCGTASYQVTGFARGEPLHVLGNNSNFVVTYARFESTGQVVMDIPGQNARRDIVTCTATTPAGSRFTFRGFFTPRG